MISFVREPACGFYAPLPPNAPIENCLNILQRTVGDYVDVRGAKPWELSPPDSCCRFFVTVMLSRPANLLLAFLCSVMIMRRGLANAAVLPRQRAERERDKQTRGRPPAAATATASATGAGHVLLIPALDVPSPKP